MLSKTFGLLILAALATGCCSKPHYGNKKYEEEDQQYNSGSNSDSSESEETTLTHVGYSKRYPESQTYKLLKDQAIYKGDAFRAIKKKVVKDSSEEESYPDGYKKYMATRQTFKYPNNLFETFSSEKQEPPYWKKAESQESFDEPKMLRFPYQNKNEAREAFTLNDEEVGESPYWKTLDNPEMFYSDEKDDLPMLRTMKKKKTRSGLAEEAELPFSNQYKTTAYYKSYFEPEQEYKYKQQEDSSEEADGIYYQRQKQRYTERHYDDFGMKPYDRDSDEYSEVKQSQKQLVRHIPHLRGRYIHNQQGTRAYGSDESNSAQDDDMIHSDHQNDITHGTSQSVM